MDGRSVDAAFELARRSVEQSEASGRIVKAAGLKTALQRLSFNAFSEAELGFPNFKSFLVEAERRGFLRVTQNAGTDLVVTTGQEPSRQPDRPRRPPFIRREYWRAFNDRTPGWRHLFHIATGEIHTIPAEPGPLGDKSSSYAAIRAEAAASPAGYLDVTPISQETEVAWMAEFAQAQSEPSRTLLLRALDSERPTSRFKAAVSMMRTEDLLWKRRRAERILEAIQDWASAHNLDNLQIVDIRPRMVAGAPSSVAPTADDQNLRRRVLRILEKLPLSELLSLRVPLEYVLEDE
jgi:hypothetical protein